MATPYMDLTRKLNAEGFPITYGEVLLVSDWYEGHEHTPLMKAARNRAYGLGVTLRILAVLHIEKKRREAIENVSAA